MILVKEVSCPLTSQPYSVQTYAVAEKSVDEASLDQVEESEGQALVIGGELTGPNRPDMSDPVADFVGIATHPSTKSWFRYSRKARRLRDGIEANTDQIARFLYHSCSKAASASRLLTCTEPVRNGH
jgi:hypothetical protein